MSKNEIIKIALTHAPTAEAESAYKALAKKYEFVAVEEADVIVALGGDGHLLKTLHRYLHLGKPVFGMNRGTVGFLMNNYKESNLVERVQKAFAVELHPLRMVAVDHDGAVTEALAMNEVSLFRAMPQAAKLRIAVDGKMRMDELVCDGVLVATPAGSTAYNLSVYGPILPLSANILALTPISPFRPRRWRGALLPHTAVIDIEILGDGIRRHVNAVADDFEVKNVKSIRIEEDRAVSFTLLFDPEMNLEDRILREQFQT